MTDTEPLEFEFVVRCGADHAFRTWTTQMAQWWPMDHSKSGDPATTVTFEPGSGGRIFEVTTRGEELEWGRVTAWEPPLRLAYLWYVGSEPDQATRVELTFREQDGTTTVRLVHSGWEIFDGDRDERRRANRHGWTTVIPAYREGASAAAT